MKAMIFAAGLGTRLRPLTDTTPKALIEVGGKPMLQRVIEKIAAAGITEMVVNVHHHSAKVKEFLQSFRLDGVTVTVSDESDRLLDTGGGVAKAASLLGHDEDILLHNADIFTDFHLADMVEHHRSTGADVTLLAAPRPTSRYLLFDRYGWMTGWENVSTGEIRSPYPQDILSGSHRLGFGGVHIISPLVLKMLTEYSPGDEKFSITPFYIENCRKLRIASFTPEEQFDWIDIGRPETLEKARQIAMNS